jgi:hypothetical protein
MEQNVLISILATNANVQMDSKGSSVKMISTNVMRTFTPASTGHCLLLVKTHLETLFVIVRQATKVVVWMNLAAMKLTSVNQNLVEITDYALINSWTILVIVMRQDSVDQRALKILMSVLKCRIIVMLMRNAAMCQETSSALAIAVTKAMVCPVLTSTSVWTHRNNHVIPMPNVEMSLEVTPVCAILGIKGMASYVWM